jgi:hypothetical protein
VGPYTSTALNAPSQPFMSNEWIQNPKMPHECLAPPRSLLRAQGKSDVHVVVVMSEGLNDGRPTAQAGVLPHENELGSRPHEKVDEVLGQPPVDLVRRPGSSLPPVAARVIHVHIEPVLMRRVAQAPEAAPEASAPGTAEISYADARRTRVICGVRPQHCEKGPNEAICAEAAPAPVG